MLTMALLAFFLVWPPITYVVHGLGIGDAFFYLGVLFLFLLATRVAFRASAVSQPGALTQKRFIAYAVLAVVPLAMALVLSLGLISGACALGRRGGT